MMHHVLLVTALTSLPLAAQEAADHQAAPDEVARLLERTIGRADLPKTDVLLLGTFHFADQGNDDYRPEHAFDVFAEARQEQIADVVARLAEFRPTVVALEWPAVEQAALDARYRKFLAGELEPSANERDQIGLRLAQRLGLQRVHAIDAAGAWLEPRVDPETWAAEHDQEGLLEDPYLPAFFEAARWLDEMKTEKTLREALLIHNDPRLVTAGHGVHLGRKLAVGDADTYPGVDGFLSHWHNRNLRIFANLRRLTDGGGQRVLVIFGAGHLGILRHSVLACPDFRLVEAADYLR